MKEPNADNWVKFERSVFEYKVNKLWNYRLAQAFSKDIVESELEYASRYSNTKKLLQSITVFLNKNSLIAYEYRIKVELKDQAPIIIELSDTN